MSKVIYSKINKERIEDFQICTKIIQGENGKYVVKEGITPQARQHLIRMKQYADMYQFEHIRPVSCEIQGESVVFSYVEGESLLEKLSLFINAGRRSEAEKLLLDYKNMIYSLGKEEAPFSCSDDFCQVFGAADGLEGVPSARYINIDNILENIIVHEGEYILIDYEWFFDFCIPYDFVIYRALLDMEILYSDKIGRMFSEDELYRLMNISPDQCEIYSKMNEQFGIYVYGGNQGYNHILRQYPITKLSLNDILAIDDVYAQLYWKTDQGYDEEHSILTPISIYDYWNRREVHIEWELPDTIEASELRIDPMNMSGIVWINQIWFVDDAGEVQSIKEYNTNGLSDDKERKLIFLSNDPQIFLGNTQRNIKKIGFEMCLTPFHTDRGEVKNIIVNSMNQLRLESEIGNVYSQLYYDTGHGFNEEESFIQWITYLEYRNSKEIMLNWELKEERILQGIRFDPINVPGYVEILKMEVCDVNGKTIRIKKIDDNQKLFGDSQQAIYLGDDPQIHYSIRSKAVKSIRIIMKILPFVHDKHYASMEDLQRMKEFVNNMG